MATMKATAKKPITREAYEAALSGYVSNDNMVCSLAAARDKEVQKLNDKYNPQAAALKLKMEEQAAIVQQYCEENRKRLFVEAKSIEECGAHIGFREGKDKVVILDGFSEKDIAAKMLKLKSLAPYVRLTPALDKTKILSERPKGLDKVGLTVGREETFFLDPVKTVVPA